MPPMTVEIRPLRDEADWQAVRAIRERVFVEEQQCPPPEEWDGFDAEARHVLLLADGRPAGAARWRVASHDGRAAAKLERFAILPPYRGLGLGRALVAWTAADAQRAGFAHQVLHAQAHLEAFYGQFGFARTGPDFWEAGIRHVPMARG